MGDVLDAGAEALREAGVPDPRREAEGILAFLLATDRGGVVARRPDPLDPAVLARFVGLVKRRRNREPFQYLTGKQEFRGLAFLVDARVLVPRPETEELVGVVLRSGLSRGARVADLGTGSGCIAVSLAVERPDLEVFALDRSQAALEVARHNAARHGVLERVRLALGSFERPPKEWLARMEAVVSNPPYVGADEWSGLSPEVRDHEPREALVPGPTGLEAYRSVSRSARGLLSEGGSLFLELGYRSEAGARQAVQSAGFSNVEVFADLRGIPRVLRAKRGVP